VTYAWEDLHWADPSTLELLTLYLQQVPTTRSLAVLTFRPEFTQPWDAHSYLSQLTLSRLGRSHVETMVEKVTGGNALPEEIIQQIVNKTDGVPLFVEELTKSVVESVGARQFSSLQLGIPATLQDALMARLDRLGTAKEIAQLGAILGREFNYELLRAVSPLNEDTLQQSLRQLVQTELVFQSGMPPQARYMFKHALVQDTAYQSLLKSKRQQLHRMIGKVLEGQFPQTVEVQPELVAHHYTEAGFIEQAIPYWQRAGERANQRSAYLEAVAHLTKGLELLTILPDMPEHAQQELLLQTALCPALTTTKGWAAPEVGKAYARARELCQQVGETPRLFLVLYGLCGFYTVRAELVTAREMGEQLLALAQREQDPALLMEAHFALGQTLLWLGEFDLAREHVEQGVILYDSQEYRSRTSMYGQDSGIGCLSAVAFALWHLGYPNQARERIANALTRTQELSHSYSLAIAPFYAAMLHQFRRQGQATEEQAEVVIVISHEHGFPFWLARATILRGWALAEQGWAEEGIAQIRRGLEAWQATSAEVFRPYFLTLLAEAYGKTNKSKEGLTVLAEASDLANKTGERFYEAELCRLKGELTLQLETRDWGLETSSSSPQASSLKPLASPAVVQEAEGYFLKAIEVARKQKAKSLELRAATSLARLWQQQGKRAEAHKLLSDVYNWFTEGFDTKDLREAKALIEELSD
jgi:predicted ATPase